MDDDTRLLPNVREMFVPDPGYLIIDCDLSGADAQVVAWEAEDEDLKDAFRKGLKLHKKNAADMWGDKWTALPEGSHEYKRRYDAIKKGVHGTNYLESARTVAITLGWPIAEAQTFQQRWFTIHPGIKRWHNRVRDGIERTRTVTNKFGFRRYYFDRIDSVLPQAVAWGPQSTVATSCFRGALQLDEALPWVEILLQVHDSLVAQVPKSRQRDIPFILPYLLNTIPYDDPLTIPWGLSISDKSWGACKEVKWEDVANMRF